MLSPASCFLLKASPHRASVLARASSATHHHAYVCWLCAVLRLLRCPWSARSVDEHEICGLLHPHRLLAGRAELAVGDVPPRPPCRAKSTSMVVILSTWCAAATVPPFHTPLTQPADLFSHRFPLLHLDALAGTSPAGHLDAFLTRAFRLSHSGGRTSIVSSVVPMSSDMRWMLRGRQLPLRSVGVCSLRDAGRPSDRTVQ